MANNVYTLKKNEDTDELHLFEGKMTGEGKCSAGPKSICTKVNRSDCSNTIFACKNEDYARSRCADHGREVCGTCVSHLYASYD